MAFDLAVERAMHVNVAPYMNLAPTTVQERASVWRAYYVFRSCALRHLPVTNSRNQVVGMLSRKDFVEIQDVDSF